MKKMLLGLLCITSSIAPSFANIAAGANALLNHIDPNMPIGISVYDLTTGNILYRKNAQELFTPASNMKLFSDASALMALGPDYHFLNQLSTNSARIEHGTLEGNLYLTLSGDPSFSHQRLQKLFASLSTWHIQRIHGNIIIDSTHANVTPSAPGWDPHDSIYSYGAPLGPVMVDANRLNITVNPGNQNNTPAVIEVHDPSHTITVDNAVRTQQSDRCGVSFSLDKNNHLTARGCIRPGQWAIQQGMAIHNPLLYAQGVIRQTLSQEHITLEGSILLGNTPKGALLVANDHSKSIAHLLADTLKPSDNLYADSLFLHAAAKLNGSPVNWDKAQPIIKQFLQQQTGIDMRNAVLVDGSGLSRFDRVTPSQTVDLLRFLHDKFPLAYEYIAALPVSGRDGTLAKRLKKEQEQDLVRAKTGTLTGVSSLSGYLYTSNGHTLTFAIFLNRGHTKKAKYLGPYSPVLDALCAYFLKQTPHSAIWSGIFPARSRLSYQAHQTQAQLQRQAQARWRQLEITLKQGLKDQNITILYRGKELVIEDHQTDPSLVLHALEKIAQKQSFAALLRSSTQPNRSGEKPIIVWDNSISQGKREWIIREAV
ncbi:MAG: D-alanyl-D-alanine carboxypeptidase/D-alanyl-D-alanine-endopeptidase [Legionellaceae bacterium]|nr:D-alanyl-D-alanine carboxypeptidase/D-alanyl-D-alanine-endopeptidase [Legionellaceae bacterium]